MVALGAAGAGTGDAHRRPCLRDCYGVVRGVADIINKTGNKMKHILIPMLVIWILSLSACGDAPASVPPPALTPAPMPSPTTTPTHESTSEPAPANENELIQELWQSLMDYNFELAGVEAMRNESIDEISDALRDGNISTLKYRKRMYEIRLIEANIIKYIDLKPQYALLHGMWEDRDPPSLAWSIPQLEKDSEKREAQFQDYLEGYIALHYDIVEDFFQFLKKRAEEQNIELDYTPSWLK